MPYTNNRGIHIHYEVEGIGPSLVLLHGGLGSVKGWYEMGYVEPLKKDYQLILIDIRGHGASDKPHNPDAYELQPLTADVVAVLDDMDVDKASTLLGYSLSGRIAFGVAKYASERFNSFIIGGAHPYMLDQNELEADIQLFKKGKDAVIAEMEKGLGSKMTPEMKARLATNDYKAIAALFSARHWRLSLEDVLPTMTMPCLIFAGETDPLYAGAKKCVQSMRNATFVSLPGLGHLGLMSQRHLVLPHITKFLTKVSQM